MNAPTRATTAGRAYLDLRNLARENRRPVDELLQLYVLEAFLARLTGSRFADQLVLKGGVLLAAFDERRPTRDIDLQGQALENDIQAIRATVCEVAAIALDDGVIFDVESATAEEIRDEEIGRRGAAGSGLRTGCPSSLKTCSQWSSVLPIQRLLVPPKADPGPRSPALGSYAALGVRHARTTSPNPRPAHGQPLVGPRRRAVSSSWVSASRRSRSATRSWPSPRSRSASRADPVGFADPVRAGRRQSER